jgi:hypothetical protein
MNTVVHRDHEAIQMQQQDAWEHVDYKQLGVLLGIIKIAEVQKSPSNSGHHHPKWARFQDHLLTLHADREQMI